MSVSVFDRNKVGTADELTPVATKNNQRVYVGTKKAVEAAMKDGNIGNNSVVYITDDYDETSMVDTANYAVTAGTADKAKVATNAVNDENGKNIAATFMPRGIDFSKPIYSKRLPSGGDISWTATQDCFLTVLIWVGPRQYASIKIDNNTIISESAGESDNAVSMSFPMLKGQTVYVYSGWIAAVKTYGYIY